jgi:ABC-type proline/glycine betaine transport system permease subunit
LSEVRESVIEFRRVSFRAAMVDNRVILAGAIPAALLALLMDLLLGLLERKLTYAH